MVPSRGRLRQGIYGPMRCRSLSTAADLRQGPQAPARLRPGVRVVLVPGISRQHRADHAADVRGLAWKEDDVLQAPVVPAGDKIAEALHAVVELVGELALPVDAFTLQLALEHPG